MNITKWDRRFLELAEMVGRWSKEPRSRVGAVIVRPNNTIAGIGYNGFPRGVYDRQDRLDNRELKNRMVVHAEQNAIYNASGPLNGCSIYVTPLCPCSQCAGAIIQVGIKRVIALPVGTHHPEWAEQEKISAQMFLESGVKYKVLKIGLQCQI